MPAYLREINMPHCAALGCEANATRELRNGYNEIINWFCARHADAALQAQRRLESK